MLILIENKTSSAIINSFEIEETDIVLNGTDVCTFEEGLTNEPSTLALVQNDILNALTAESWKDLICV